MFISILTLVATLQFSHLTQAAPFQEQILAQNLIGSHFGVPGVPASYDYVVLGGGTGGLALATRLAQSGAYSVAVVEAGDFYEFTNGNLSEIPADAAAFIDTSTRNPLLDWYQFTESQTVSACQVLALPTPCTNTDMSLKGLAGRSIYFPSGKVLGGSSARNFMWFHR